MSTASHPPGPLPGNISSLDASAESDDSTTRSIRARGASGDSVPDRMALRISAALLLVGQFLFIAVGQFHPDRERANDHAAVFAEYAASGAWTLVHLGQFATMAVAIAGLLALFFALNVRAGAAGWASRFAAASALATLALYGVLQAVDGVALKQAVNAWAAAPDTEKAARFASAETIRWLEWAVRSYQSFMLGVTLVLFAAAIAWSARIPKPIGYLMGLCGLAYVAQGFVLGAEGFSEANAAPTLLGYALALAWMIWLAVVAWRTKEPVAETPAAPSR
jgi:hypothetical protein